MRTVVLGPGERLKPAQLTRKGVLPPTSSRRARHCGDGACRGRCGAQPVCATSMGSSSRACACPTRRSRTRSTRRAAFAAALERAAAQIRAFHERELTQSWFTTRPDGTLLGVKVTPVAAAGIYVRADAPNIPRRSS